MTSLTAAILLPAITGCASETYPRLYHTEAKAPSIPWEELQDLSHMGATVIDRGINFSVYSESATRIELLLFDDPESDLPAQQFELERQGDIWNIYVEGIGIGQHYGYIAWGPNWEYDEDWLPGTTTGFEADVDSAGNRFNPNKLLFDPWGKALHRDHDWSKGSTASGPQRAQSTYAAAAKTVVTRYDNKDDHSEYAWSDHEKEWRELRQSDSHEGHGWEDLIIYEVHPKGLTNNPASGVEHPGTYRGIGEMAPYLKDLGITAVELLPIHEKPLDGGYWGYNSLSFFAPEHTFSADFQSSGEVDGVLDEFKWMVDQLHQNDIEVILDVVYNHTGEGGLWRQRLYFDLWEHTEEINFDPVEVAGLYSYRGLDNYSWYAMDPDVGNESYLLSHTGVGNQTRSNHTPMRRLIMDSLRFCVEELHVDGFRFDLAGVLGEADLDYWNVAEPDDSVLQDIVDDEMFQQYNVRLISEPWTAAGTGPGIGNFQSARNHETYAWAEWNPYFRDWWRAIVNNCNWGDNGYRECHGWDEGNYWNLSSYEGPVAGGQALTGASDVYGESGDERKPYHSINFITVHDGFTLYDALSYNQKQNGCGLLNPICCEDEMSVWCDTESGSDDNRSYNWWDEGTKRQMMRNLFAALMLSHGTPMILGGDEWMRTKYGNNDSYSTWSDNEWNWFRWGEWQSTSAPERARMHDFVRNIIEFRKRNTHAFSPTEYGGGMSYAWKDASNGENVDWGGRHLMMHYYGEGKELAVIMNMERSDVEFTLPEGREWQVVADTQSHYDSESYLQESGRSNQESANISLEGSDGEVGSTISGSYVAKGITFVVLEEK